MASLQDQAELQLCETCKSIAFDVLVYGVEGTPALVPYQVQGKNSIPIVELGPLHTILQRAPICSFCTLISEASEEQQLGKHFSELQKVVCLIKREEFWYEGSEWKDDEDDFRLKPSENKAMYRLVVTAGLPPMGRSLEGKKGDRRLLYLHPCVHPVPTVEWACGQGGLVPPVLGSGRLMAPLIDVRLLRQWLGQCETLHGATCALPSWWNAIDNQPSGLRMIDVRRRCIVDAPDHCRYFALSYMWGAPGAAGHFLTTSGNINQLRVPGSLSFQSLPQTIGDAMRLVNDLGESYLWVDAICILQDVDQDKALFIPVMDLIYSLAVLTIIAASGDSSGAGLAGLYSAPRKLAPQSVVRVSKELTLITTFNTAAGLSNCKWNTRGWTMQERLCSRRVLMFTDDQVYWNCGEANWCEQIALEFGPSKESIVKWGLGCYSDGSRDGFDDNIYELLDINRTEYLIVQYSNRNLTNQSDALDAITGLLHRVTRVSGVRFHWGLPVSRFGEILSFWWIDSAHDKARRTDTCRVYCEDGSIHQVLFPSWSWLGWLGEVCVDFPLPLGNVQSELEFYRVDIDGSRLRKIDEGDQQANFEFVQPIDEQLRSLWKIGSTTLETDNIQNGRCFRDSGMLRFWTSHALLWLMDSDDDSRCGVLDSEGNEVGYVIRWKQSVRERELYSFIVLSRHHTYHLDINVTPRVEKVIPHLELHVMLVRWIDGMASRVTVGTVSERAWVEAKPQWTLVTLQ
ncbi:hypothetical protein KC19_8G104000 [Ceratodon purpureus]|uniref:Heterokaryon incompatibility domain-containing protein n=1 Tax=Ceratodon purpureus TaxID=3225 RepID=A0A8T0H0M5_CERPU|nr:hypothetical protein KC19_8G104000 [Ceratodon purpureus]